MHGRRLEEARTNSKNTPCTLLRTELISGFQPNLGSECWPKLMSQTIKVCPACWGHS